MTEGVFLALAAALPSGSVELSTHAVLLPAEAPPEWVQLLPLGEVKGRDGRGPYRVGDRAKAEVIIAATLARSGGSPLPIDYDHQSDLAAVEGVGGTAPAAGWMTELQVRDGAEAGIWAKVDWTAPGAERLRAKEYRFISPVFQHTKEDGTVLRLLRAGLTNNPNFDLVALASAGARDEGVSMDPVLKALLEALGLPATTTTETAIAAVRTLRTGVSQVAVAAGLKDDAGLDAIATAIAASRDPAKNPALTALQAQVTALQGQLETTAKERKKDAAAAVIDKAIAEGRLVPATRDEMVAWHQADETACAAFLAKQPVVIRPGTQLAGGPPAAGADGLTGDELAVCAALGLAPDKFKAQKAKGV